MEDGIGPLKEAFELFKLQTNTSLLDYGLQMGIIERSQSGQMTMELLNMKILSISQVVERLLIELLMRLGLFVSAAGLVKSAIDSELDNQELEDGVRGLYLLCIVLHQMINFRETSIRTINRSLMSVAIVLFSLTAANKPPCEDMRNFKHKIRRRLTIDYYLWCLLLAMDLVLTMSSPIYINLEQEYGIEVNISHVILSSYCVIHLSGSMQMIGHGRLNPLIAGTPLLFLDAGDDITLAKGLALFLFYLCFWSSDWRELVDWNHTMLCEAGICKVLSTEQGNLKQIVKKAKRKFDDWRLEEGLDDDGWFIMLDPPRTNEAADDDDVVDGRVLAQHDGGYASEEEDEDGEDDTDTNGPDPDGRERRRRPAENQQRPQLVDYTGRVIYLQSRNPLLTSLAAIMLIIWK